MKKSHFGAIVMSGLLISTVAFAQGPAPTVAPAATTVQPVVGGEVAGKANAGGELSAQETVHMQGGEKTVTSKNAETGTEAGKQNQVSGTMSLDANSHPMPGSQGHVVNSLSANVEYAQGQYIKTPALVSSDNVVANAQYEQNTASGQLGGSTVAIGVQSTQGSRAAPIGTQGHLPIQPGRSSRTTAMVEAGAGQLDGLQKHTSLILNITYQTALQYCKSIGRNGEAALCAEVILSAKLGTEQTGAVASTIRYAHVIADSSNKNFWYAGVTGNVAATTTAIGTHHSDGDFNGAAQGGLVIGIATGAM